LQKGVSARGHGGEVSKEAISLIPDSGGRKWGRVEPRKRDGGYYGLQNGNYIRTSP